MNPDQLEARVIELIRQHVPKAVPPPCQHIVILQPMDTTNLGHNMYYRSPRQAECLRCGQKLRISVEEFIP